jgi:hypothetical protein
MTKRYQWGKQKPSIEKGQTILCPIDTNGVIRSLQLKRDRQYYDQKIGHSIVCPFSIEGF